MFYSLFGSFDVQSDQPKCQVMGNLDRILFPPKIKFQFSILPISFKKFFK